MISHCRAYRESVGTTQRRVATRMGREYARITGIENFRTKSPLTTFLDYVDACGLEIVLRPKRNPKA